MSTRLSARSRLPAVAEVVFPLTTQFTGHRDTACAIPRHEWLLAQMREEVSPEKRCARWWNAMVKNSEAGCPVSSALRIESKLSAFFGPWRVSAAPRTYAGNRWQITRALR